MCWLCGPCAPRDEEQAPGAKAGCQTVMPLLATTVSVLARRGQQPATQHPLAAGRWLGSETAPVSVVPCIHLSPALTAVTPAAGIVARQGSVGRWKLPGPLLGSRRGSTVQPACLSWSMLSCIGQCCHALVNAIMLLQRASLHTCLPEHAASEDCPWQTCVPQSTGTLVLADESRAPAMAAEAFAARLLQLQLAATC